MKLSDLDVHELGDRVKALHGDEVYQATLALALAIATRNRVPLGKSTPNAPGEAASPHNALTTEAVLAALRTEFLKLLRPN